MDIITNISGTKAVIALRGKLTVQTSSDLSTVIGTLPRKACDIDINLSEVDYVASAGLRVFVTADKLAVARGGTMRLLHPCDEVLNSLYMTGLSEIFAIER